MAPNVDVDNVKICIEMGTQGRNEDDATRGWLAGTEESLPFSSLQAQNPFVFCHHSNWRMYETVVAFEGDLELSLSITVWMMLDEKFSRELHLLSFRAR